MTTREAVLRFLECNPGSYAHDVSQGTVRPLRTVQRHLTKLTLEGVIHITGYELRVSGSGKPGPMYAVGPGENARPIRVTNLQRRRRKTNWLRQKRSQERVLERAADMGVFGVVAAQLERRRKR